MTRAIKIWVSSKLDIYIYFNFNDKFFLRCTCFLFSNLECYQDCSVISKYMSTSLYLTQNFFDLYTCVYCLVSYRETSITFASFHSKDSPYMLAHRKHAAHSLQLASIPRYTLREQNLHRLSNQILLLERLAQLLSCWALDVRVQRSLICVSISTRQISFFCCTNKKFQVRSRDLQTFWFQGLRDRERWKAKGQMYSRL